MSGDALNSIAAEAWRALGEDAALLPWLLEGAVPAHLPCPLPVGDLATASVRLAAAQAMLMAHDRGGSPGDPLWGDTPRSDPDRVAASFSSDRFFRWNGERPQVWAPLSGFWEAGDGWVRTHANYPHHRARLLRVTGLPENARPDDLRAVLREREVSEWEDRAADLGAIVVAVRSLDQWRSHSQARAVGGRPLLDVGDLPRAGERELRSSAPGDAPLSGIRVLDLTRVIAGPVATRTLAHLGAEVLRIDPPRLPESQWQYLDTGPGKRSATLDLTRSEDRTVFDGLLAGADVLVLGYRPASLDRFGLSTEELCERHPGLVIGRVSAWGDTGPWRHRRGFDSIVQAATGIASLTSPDGIAPGALPAQALDHSAGYLLAAGLVRGLRDRAGDGRGRSVSVSLARIAHALVVAPRRTETVPDLDPEGHIRRGSGSAGSVDLVAPAFTVPGVPDSYPWMARRGNVDAAEWSHTR